MIKSDRDEGIFFLQNYYVEEKEIKEGNIYKKSVLEMWK